MSLSFRGEYICISCWTSFEGAPNGQGHVTCPHCDFVQPVGDEPDATVQSSIPEAVARQAPVAAKAPPVAPPAAKSVPPAPKSFPPRAAEPKPQPAKGLEPLSLDSLESFSQEESIPPPVPPPPAKERAVPPPSRSASLPPTPHEELEPPAPAPDVSLSDTTVWRVKSDSGLTYCFFSAEKLIRWVEGLGPQRNAMVSVDGINWKAYADFKQKYAGEAEAMAALEASAEGRPVASAPAGGAPSVATSLPPKRDPKAPARTVTSMQATQARGPQGARTGARAKQQTTGELRRAAQVTGERPAPADTSTTGRRPTPAATNAGWGARIGFMAAGMVLGGAGVYFGMYLMGFYDLAMPF